MTRIAVALCALGLANATLGATPAEEFTARGKELLANKEARFDADRLHRLLDISWEYAMKESPEFATAIGYPGQNDRWIDMPFEAIARAEGNRQARPRSDQIDFQDNSGTPPHDIEVEVDRYIVWPSQALGDKIGQLKIQGLRAYAEKELGQKMDLRAYHDEVLKNGALPMSVLETHIKDWVAKRKGA